MKVLFIVEHYYPYIGGVEKLFKTLAEGLYQKGYQPTVITTKHQPNLPDKEVVNGVEIRRIPVANRYLFTFFGWLYMLKAAKRADLIHTTSYNAAFPAWVAAKFTGKKCVITFHEVWGKQWFSVPFLSALVKWAFYAYEAFILRLRFAKWVAVSEYTFQQLKSQNLPYQKLRLIYNGVNPVKTKWKGPRQDGFHYVFFGRLGVSKGIDVMVKGASTFNREHSNAFFHFVLPKYPRGIRKKVLQLIKQTHLKQYHLYHELKYSHLLDLITSSSCVVIPSLSEGFGFSAAECCAMGIPVVSSERGALKEVTCGKVIRISPYSPVGLVQALKRASENDYKEKPTKQFPLAEMVLRYQSLYEEVLS